MKFYHIALLGFGLVSSVNAADITILYSPTCPHCHHARDFIKNELIYEYNDLKVTEINATLMDSRQDFVDALNKCQFTSGGVPIMIVGDKCFQGYGDGMKDSLREAIEIDLSDEQKQSAVANRSELGANHDEFVAAHEQRKTAIVDKYVEPKQD